MKKLLPPMALIQTWLYLASSNTDELKAAKLIASRNLEQVFGNVDIAQVYFEHHNQKSNSCNKIA